MAGHQIKSLRKRLGWTQAKLAEVLGCTHRTIRNWESGRHTVPRAAVVLMRMLDRESFKCHSDGDLEAMVAM